jgi:hypothetical protein
MLSHAIRLALVVLVLAITAAPVGACDTPVFRVALFDPRWRPNPYEFTIVRDGTLPRTEQKALHRLDDFLDKHKDNVNYTLEVVQWAKQKPADLRDILKVRRTSAASPQLAVAYPNLSRIDANLWVGRLKDAPLYELLQSPMRSEIGKRLLAGETAVWVLIESGNQSKDSAAFAILANELKRMQTNLKLPEPGPGGKKIAIPDWAPPAQIAFSVLRLSRIDEAERWFVAMLLGLESDLDQYASQPIAFAVFGRGNALEPLIGKGITPMNISRAMTYLAGPCTCEEKAANPVKDLLMVVDWDHGKVLPPVAEWFTPSSVPAPSKPASPKDMNQSAVTDTPQAATQLHTISTPEPEEMGADVSDGWWSASVWLGLAIGLVSITAIGLAVRAKWKRQ